MTYKLTHPPAPLPPIEPDAPHADAIIPVVYTDDATGDEAHVECLAADAHALPTEAADRAALARVAVLAPRRGAEP